MSAAQVLGQKIGCDLVEHPKYPACAEAAAGQQQLQQSVSECAFAGAVGQFVGHQASLNRGGEVDDRRYSPHPRGGVGDRVPCGEARTDQLRHGPHIFRSRIFSTQQAEVRCLEAL